MKIGRNVQYVKMKQALRRFSDFYLLKCLVFYISIWVLVLVISRYSELPRPIFLQVKEMFAGRYEVVESHSCEMGSMSDMKQIQQWMALFVAIYLIYQTSETRQPFDEGYWM